MEIFNIKISDFHPIVVHFPIALLSVGFLFDLIGNRNNSDSFKDSGWYCMIAGIISLIPVFITGIIDNNNNSAGFLEFPPSLNELFYMHGYIVITASVLFLGMFYYRWKHSRLTDKLYFIVVGLGLLIMFYGAMLGGEFSH